MEETLLRQVRKDLGITIRALADAIAAPYESIQQLDSGRYNGQPWVIDLIILEMIRISQAPEETKERISTESRSRQASRRKIVGRKHK